jgi:hypothetical protein
VTGRRLRLSPSGNLIAATSRFEDEVGPTEPTTNLYSNGTLVSAANGWAVEWLDDTRVFLNSYIDRRGFPSYSTSRVVNTTGQVVATASFTFEPHPIQSLGNDLVYVSNFKSIRNASTSPHDNTYGDSGAVAGNFVFFPSQHTLRAEPR